MNALLMALLLTADGGAVEPVDPDKTVQLDLSRYLGTWYEIARFPNFFEKGCVGVTATYSKGEGNEVVVLNRCLQDKLDGEVKRANGKAWAPDPKQPGKLKVQFFWPFSGDYWVLEVGEQYEYAVIGSGKRSSCWVMSRTPTMDPTLYADIVTRLKARGYEVAKLEKVLQKTP
jgi:apolipoprotein D and lipocalin family protein